MEAWRSRASAELGTKDVSKQKTPGGWLVGWRGRNTKHRAGGWVIGGGGHAVWACENVLYN
jgi:hypothetical protein